MEGVFVVQLGERRRSAFRPNDRTAIHYYLTPFDLSLGPSKNITIPKGGNEPGLSLMWPIGVWFSFCGRESL